jgi:hypothetical protein
MVYPHYAKGDLAKKQIEFPFEQGGPAMWKMVLLVLQDHGSDPSSCAARTALS